MFRRRRLAGMAVSTLASLAVVPTVQAQASNDRDQSLRAQTLEEIVVTASSRVNRSGFEAPTPTTVLSESLLEDNAVGTIGDLSKLIPQQAELNSPTAFTQGFSNVAATTFNLRGLGSVRTLVLVDGRRHVPTAASTGLNVDVIPTALIERVEIVTGGASADWGSDAVAGVVNLVLKDELDGFDTSVSGGFADEGGHENHLASAAWGAKFADGRGNVMIGAEWYKNEGILTHAERDWGREQWGLLRNPNYTDSNGEYSMVLVPNFQSSSATLGGLITTGVARGTDFGAGGVPRELVTGDYFNPASFSADPSGFPYPGNHMSGGSGITPGIYVPIEQPVERAGAMARTTWDFSDDLSFFAEGSFTEITSESPTAFAHDAGIIFSAPFTMTIDNAFLPDAIRSQMAAAGETFFRMGRYNTDLGFIEGRGEFNTTRLVAGLQGGLGKFDWEGYYQYGRSTADDAAINNVLTANLNRAVDSVLVGGVPTCRVNADADAANDDPVCVPINLFGHGSPSQAALDYIHADARREVQIDQHVVSLALTGDPISNWAGAVSVALGAEWRAEDLHQESDPLSQAGAFFIGQTASTLSGDVEVAEAYAQGVVPLLSGVTLAEQVEFLGAVRQSYYDVKGPVTFPSPGIESRSFDVTTWKAGLSWSVNESLRFRAVQSRDIRAPNINELFTAGNIATAGVFFEGEAITFPRIRGGNIDLEPEKADSLILGVVYQPGWLDGLKLAVDRYDIEIDDAIASAAGTPQQLIDACVAGDQDICGLFTFDQNGVPTELRGTTVNVNRFRSRGWDFEIRYDTELLGGTIGFGAAGTRAVELSQATTVAVDDRVGENGNNSSFRMPKWQIRTSIDYQRGPVSLYVGGRYISSGKYNIDYNLGGARDLEMNDMPSRFYVTLSGGYEVFSDDRGALEVFAVVNNLFDKDPPVHPQDFWIPIQGSGLYDTIGRAYTLGFRYGH